MTNIEDIRGVGYKVKIHKVYVCCNKCNNFIKHW